MDYFSKMKGTTKSPPAVGLSEIIWSWIGSFLGIAAVAVVNYSIVDKTDLVMIIGSFGASAVLILRSYPQPPGPAEKPYRRPYDFCCYWCHHL